MFKLSPLGRRRFERFKKNRRGWWSLWLFIGLFMLSLGGELIANDKPLVIRYHDGFYFPILSDYLETDFGGELPFQPDYASSYVHKLIEDQGGWMLFPPIPFSYDTVNYDLTEPAPSPPSSSTARPEPACSAPPSPPAASATSSATPPPPACSPPTMRRPPDAPSARPAR